MGVCAQGTHLYPRQINDWEMIPRRTWPTQYSLRSGSTAQDRNYRGSLGVLTSLSPECQLVDIIRGLLCTEYLTSGYSYINYSVLRKACPFLVPLLAMVNMVLASICHPHDTGSSRHPRNTITLLLLYYPGYIRT